MTPKSKASLTRRLRRAQKFVSNLWVTVICGLMTILVLKGGALSFGISSKGAENHNRLLTEAIGKGRVLPEQRQMVKLPEEERVTTRGSSLPMGSEEPRLVLISGAQPELCPYTAKVLKNKAAYCSLHNIHFFPNTTSPFSPHKSQFNSIQFISGFWSHVPHILSFMVSHPNFEWVWWIDSLALITDMSFPLPMDKYKHHNFVLHGCGNQPCDLANFATLNISSIFIRNSNSSLQLLDSFIAQGSTSRVLDKKSSLKDFVFVEDSKHFFGFWVQVVDQIETSDPGFGDDSWPFLTHFGGCNMCASHGDYSLSKCVKHMDTALKYGYNQVKAYE